MGDSELDALKAAAGVSSDAELAKMLGIRQSAISQWKSRGRVPEKYKMIYQNELSKSDQSNAFRLHLYKYYENHYFIMAAMAFMTRIDMEDLPGIEVGKQLEQALLDLSAIALKATEHDLRKRIIVNEDDCQTLINIMRRNYKGEIDAVLNRIGIREGDK